MKFYFYTLLILYFLIPNCLFSNDNEIPFVQNKKFETLKLDKQTTEKLNALLGSAEKLRISLIRQDEDQIEFSIYDLNNQLLEIRKSIDTRHQRSSVSLPVPIYNHLQKTLQKIIELTSKVMTTHDSQNYIDLFSQLVSITHSYKLESKYKIHFCNKDNISWIENDQSNLKGIILPNHNRNCNIKVK